MNISKVKQPITITELVGKYNQICLDGLSSMYYDKNYQLNSEYKCHRDILKADSRIKIDNFDKYCLKNGYPNSSLLLKEHGLYSFSVENKMDYSFVGSLTQNQIYPFPELNKMLDLISFDKTPVILTLLKTYFEKKCSDLKDIQSDFLIETKDNIPKSFDKYSIWNEFIEDEEISIQVKLEFIRILVQHHSSIHLYLRLMKHESNDEVMYDRIKVDVEPIYEKNIVLSHGGRQSIEFLLEHQFDLPKYDTYLLFCGWFIYDPKQKEGDGKIWYEKDELTNYGDDYITKNAIETMEWTDTFLYDEKEYVWSQMKEGVLYPRFLMYLNTFRQFMYERIKPEDRERYCFAGSMVKAFYKIREVKDIDFLVSDTNGKIETYSSFTPKLGENIKGVMDDFGRTFYSIEEYYFPMIPELYKSQTQQKEEIREEEKVNLPDGLITNLVPKYSASGLKAGRYIDIYSQQINSFIKSMELKDKNLRPFIQTLDDILFYPGHHINIGGIKFIPLEYEVIRDHMKDLDLKRVSKKQMMDFCEINRDYSSKQTNPELWMKKLSIENFRFEKANLITNHPCSFLEWNLYHGRLLSGKKMGYEVLIRRSPLKIKEAITNLLKDGLLDTIGKNEMPNLNLSLHLKKINGANELTGVIHTNDDWINNQRFLRNVLITSIPPKIQRFKSNGSIEIFPSIWNYVITNKGELNICLITNPFELGSWMPAFVDDKDRIISAGQLKVMEDKEGEIHIYYNLRSSKIMIPILKKYDKKYENAVYQFTKSVFQLHRFFDTLSKKKITLQYQTDTLLDNVGDCNGSGFTNRIFKTNKSHSMKLWQEKSKSSINNPSQLTEFLTETSKI